MHANNVTLNLSSSLRFAIRWCHDTCFTLFKYHCCNRSSYFWNYSNFSEHFTPFKTLMVTTNADILLFILFSIKKVIFIYICYHINDIFQNVHAAFSVFETEC